MVVSVVIPAHNEAKVIGRLLDALLAEADPAEFEVLVMCNGCTDGSADLARTYAGVQVHETEVASKHFALVAADAIATQFPRLYIDADVTVSTADVRLLVAALAEPGVLAAAPRRQLVVDASAWPVRAYYRVWERLPAVREGLFGRGVLAVTEAGFARLTDRPQVLGDDSYVHSQFGPHERRVVPEAVSVVRAPLTVRDLVRRRTRAAQGNTELGTLTGGRTNTASGSAGELVRIARHEPRLWSSLPAFLGVTALARWQARRSGTGSAGPWLRDESSRS